MPHTSRSLFATCLPANNNHKSRSLPAVCIKAPSFRRLATLAITSLALLSINTLPDPAVPCLRS